MPQRSQMPQTSKNPHLSEYIEKIIQIKNATLLIHN